jgi:uncharacterized C2H2 Zn-finger protein
MSEARKCPRCEAAAILFLENDDGSVSKLGALSRVARDDGAEVLVCPRCGDREALYGYDPAQQIPLAEWLVSVERLLAEERALIEQWRRSPRAGRPEDPRSE